MKTSAPLDIDSSTFTAIALHTCSVVVDKESKCTDPWQQIILRLCLLLKKLTFGLSEADFTIYILSDGIGCPTLSPGWRVMWTERLQSEFCFNVYSNPESQGQGQEHYLHSSHAHFSNIFCLATFPAYHTHFVVHTIL